MKEQHEAHADAGIRAGRGASELGLVTSGLLALSAVLQSIAAVQRWGQHGGTDEAIEDHAFDYVIPADPWVSVGQAAVLFGIGYLLIGAAIVCVGVAARSAIAAGRSTVVAAIISAVFFAFFGSHALVSGLMGRPTPLQDVLATVGGAVIGLAQVLSLVVLAAMVLRRSATWAVGLLLLGGTSMIGYLVAVFAIAPMIVGYQSYDTTPWSEGVLAAITAVSAVVFLGGSWVIRTVPREEEEAGFEVTDPRLPRTGRLRR